MDGKNKGTFPAKSLNEKFAYVRRLEEYEAAEREKQYQRQLAEMERKFREQNLKK